VDGQQAIVAFPWTSRRVQRGPVPRPAARRSPRTCWIASCTGCSRSGSAWRVRRASPPRWSRSVCAALDETIHEIRDVAFGGEGPRPV